MGPIEAEEFLLLHGYRRCDIAACNCGSWHGGHANMRLRELREAFEQDELTETNGRTLLNLVCEVLTSRSELQRDLAAARARIAELEMQRDSYKTWWERDSKSLSTVISERNMARAIAEDRRAQLVTAERERDALRADAENLATMLRRGVWLARKEPGDTGTKVWAGKAMELLRHMGRAGNVLRDDAAIDKARAALAKAKP